MPERPYYHSHFKLKEYLYYLGQITFKPVSMKEVKMAIKKVSLEDVQDEYIKTFSKGMLQRVGLAQAFLQNPRVLILDEPMSGLDPVGQSKIRDIIFNINEKGTTLLITSHNLYEIEHLSNQIGILDEGKVNLLSDGALNHKKKVQVKILLFSRIDFLLAGAYWYRLYILLL